MEDIFIGREDELSELESYYAEPGLTTVAITGRRRIGKTSLLLRFAEGKRCLFFTFFKEDGIEDNLRGMRRVLSMFGKKDLPRFESLLDALDAILEVCREEKTLLILDEYPFLAESSGSADSMMQRFLDVDLRGTDTTVVVCGSSIGMMEKHVYSPKGPLYNRFPNSIRLGPLTPGECMRFHPGLKLWDQARIYMTVGGVPYYHRVMNGSTYEECIAVCFFSIDGPLVEEAENMMTSELSPYHTYSAVISCMAEGITRQTDIANTLGISKGLCSQYISKLESLGFVWEPEAMLWKGKKPKLEIEDNLLAFWYEVVRDRRAGIGHVSPELLVADAKEEISTHLGRRFELLTRDYLARSYPVMRSGKWIGKVEGEETDIDAVAETLEEGKRTSIILCECKFTREKAGFSAYNKLRANARAAGCEYNRRLAIASGSGFKDDLQEWAEENGEPWLIGLEKIFGLESPDPL